jgi:nucleoside 2-deoxyribosyltransferase
MVCGSIGRRGTQKIKSLYAFIRRNGFATLDHLSAHEMDYTYIKDFRTKRELAHKIVEHDLEFVRKADILIAIYDAPSHGTGIEMFVAKNLGKHVILFAPQPVPTPWPIHFSSFVISNKRELVRLLKRLQSKFKRAT